MDGLEFFPSHQMVVSPTGSIGYGSAPPMAFIAPAPTSLPSTGHTQPVQMSHAIASPSDVLSGVSLLTPAASAPPVFGENAITAPQTMGGIFGATAATLAPMMLPGVTGAGPFAALGVGLGINQLMDNAIAANSGISSGAALQTYTNSVANGGFSSFGFAGN